MIRQHQSFDEIPDDTILWQYMPLTKFLFLIKNKKLHFHRIDDFMDKEEGILSVLDKKSLPFYENTEKWNNYLENDRKRFFISCWINHPIEQSLMWYTYGKDGVAVCSTAGAVRRALEIDKEHLVRMIGVRYIDKEKESVQTPDSRINVLRFLTSKRNFFEMEKEVRLLFCDEDKKYTEQKGINFDASIDELIKEIKVATTVPGYVYDLLCQEVKDAGIEIIPERSKI